MTLSKTFRYQILFGLAAVAGVIIVVSLLLLETRGRRSTHPEHWCLSNVGSISKAMLLYRSEFGDVYPCDLSLLIKRDLLSPKGLLCPAADCCKYAHCPGFAEAKDAADILIHSSYIYVPLDVNSPDDVGCIFELPINHRQEYFSFARANADVSRIGYDEFFARVQNLNDYLCRERERKNVR